MSTTFYSGGDYEVNGPRVNISLDASADLWPHGLASEIGGGDKDVLEDGLHPVLAIGAKADRAATTPVGIVITYDATLDRAVVNVAHGLIVKAYVSNVLTYSGTAATFESTPVIGQPVYVDDSADLPAGVTLSCSPLNSAGSDNPLAGFLMYCQDDYDDSGIGGHSANLDTAWAETIETNEVCVLLK